MSWFEWGWKVGEAEVEQIATILQSGALKYHGYVVALLYVVIGSEGLVGSGEARFGLSLA